MKARAIPYNTEVCGSFRVLSVAVAMPLMASRGRRFKACPRYKCKHQFRGGSGVIRRLPVFVGDGAAQVVPVRIDETLLSALTERADHDQVSRSEAIRAAIRAYVA